MVTVLSELVHFVGEETALVSRVKQAVEWVASKPEGLAALEEARALHGKPLTIVTDSRVHDGGFGDYLGTHAVFANPALNEHWFVHGQNGERIHMGLERFFSHEFKHATQPNALENIERYGARLQQIRDSCEPTVPWENYNHRIKAVAGNNHTLKELIAEIYDTHIGPATAKAIDDAIHKASADPIVQEFVGKYEMPAIEFENLMMQKYKSEPGRMLDYLKSDATDYEKMVSSSSFRDNYIAGVFEGVRAHIPEETARGAGTSRGSERTIPKPRTGSWTENT